MNKTIRLGSHEQAGDVSGAGQTRLFFIATYTLRNTGGLPLPFDYRVRLNHAKAGGDPTWFEYTPERGVTEDFIHSQTNSHGLIVTLHGASRTTQPTLGNIAGKTTVRLSMGFALPGPAISRAMGAFWGQEPFYDFNVLVHPYEILGTGPKRLAEHEWKQFVRLHM